MRRELRRELDEFYWVLEGEYRFTIDEEQFIAGSDGFVFIPGGTPHGWVVGDQGGRTLISFAPAGGERVSARSRPPRPRAATPQRTGHGLGAETHTRWLS